jgi:hypothetical protein
MKTKPEIFSLDNVVGSVEVWVITNGILTKHTKASNSLTDNFGDFAAGAVVGLYVPDKFKIGTGTTPADPTDNDLETPVAGFSKDIGTLSANSNVVSMELHVAAEEAHAGNPVISEFGIYYNSGSILLARVVIDDPITKTDSATINILWTWTLINPS